MDWFLEDDKSSPENFMQFGQVVFEKYRSVTHKNYRRVTHKSYTQNHLAFHAHLSEDRELKSKHFGVGFI